MSYQLLAPLPSLATAPPAKAPSAEAAKPPGIDQLGYDPNWVTPAKPAPISALDGGGNSATGDPSIGGAPETASGRAPAVPTEVPSLRSEFSRTIANPDGTFSQEISQARMNFPDATGAWQPLDLHLVTDPNGAYSLKVAASDRSVRFGSADAKTGLAELSGDGHVISLKAVEFGAGQQVGENALGFAGTGNNGALGVLATDTGFEFSVTLDNANQSGSYHFVLDTGDLVASLAEDGQTILLRPSVKSGTLLGLDLGDSQVLGRISAPGLLEAGSARIDSTPVSVQLTNQALGEVLVTYTIDPTWLQDKGRQFPVILDPTVCIGVGQSGCLSGNDDEFIFSYNPNAYALGWTVVRMGYDNNSGDNFPGNANYAITRGLFYFPDVKLNDPYGDAIVTAADLAMTINADQTNYGNTAVGKTYYAYPINTPWATNSVTWNSLIPNGFDTTPVSPGVTIPTSPNGKVLTFDIKDLARRWYTRRGADWHTDEGVMIKSGTSAHTEVLADGELYIYKYNEATTTKRPKLTITYELPKVQIDFDPALGNTYAPTSMVAGQATKLPIKVLNNGSTFSFDANWKIGWRFFDGSGAIAASGTQALPATIAPNAWSALFNLVVTPPAAGQYTLRLDLVRVVSGTNLYASDWAKPSAYYSRNKKILTSDSTRWTGTSAIERDEFGITVTTGAGASGVSQAVGGLSINLSSGNLHFTGDSGLGFSDLISPTLSYGFDKVNTGDCTGILAGCGWFTNWDERLTTANGGVGFTYQDPDGNRYFVNGSADGQWLSPAPVLIQRTRVTGWDESNPGGWSGGTLPTVSTAFAFSGTHSLSTPASEAGTQTDLASQVDLLHYQRLNLWVKSSGTDKAAIGFRVLDHDNPASVNWFFYTFGGTSWTVTGFPTKWINTGTALTSAGGYWLPQQNVWADARAAISTLGTNLYFARVDLRGAAGATGSLYYDALAFVGMTSVNFDDAQPAWTSGSGYASLNSGDKTTGSSSLQISPTGNPDCAGCKSTDLLQYPFLAWDWKKVGGTTIGHVFHFKDARDLTKVGDITYYAGQLPPPGAVNPVQVSPTLPTEWTHVQRNLLEDARQILGFYFDDPLGTNPAAPPSAPLPDPVTLTGYSLIASDGSFALFDYEQHRSSPGLGSAIAAYADDWTVTFADRSTHFFNFDGKLERIVDPDANTLDLVWTYNFASSGPNAYSLTTIRAAADGMGLSSGTAQREIAVSTTTPTGFRQITFTEQLGSTSSYTGRRADFYVATTTGTTWGIGDLIKVSPGRNNSATCGTRPNGCVEFDYTGTTTHNINLVADPRWDGSTSGVNDMRLDVNYEAGVPYKANQVLDRANASVARLYVETFDDPTVAIGYRRVLYQDAANRASNYASYLDLTPDGQPLVTYVPLVCSGTCSTTSSTWPADPLSTDKLNESSFDGLSHISQTTSYRVNGAGPQQREVQRHASNAGAKVDNLSDPLGAAQLSWTQTSDQYFASLLDSGGKNADLYRTEYAYNAADQPVVVMGPVANAHPDYAGAMKANSNQSAYWRLGETSGTTAADSSGNGNTATISATGVTLNQPGALTNDANGAMLLNGTTGRLTSAVSLSQTAYTLEAWVNQQTAYTSGGRGIVGDWASTGALLYLSSGTLTMVHGSTYLFTPITLAVGRWYHVAGTWDGAVMRLYLDGEQVASKAVGTAPGSGATAFEIGSYLNGSGPTFNNARFDEVGLWSAALQPQQLLSHYLAGRSIALPNQRTTYDAEGHPTQRATHFLGNGGFESGLAEWENGNGATISSTNVNSGQLALQITGSAYARQDAQLVPGQTARWQFAVKTDGVGTTRGTYSAYYWQVSSQSWVTIVSTSHQTSTWTGYAFDITVPFDSDGRLRVSFSNVALTGTAYFDDAVIVTDWSHATYSSLGLVTDTFSLQPGNSSAATLRTNLAYAAATTYPAIFPTTHIANWVNGVYSDTIRDEDLISTRTFDRWGRVVGSADPDGVTDTTAYATNMTDIASTADGLGNTTAYTYDKVGHPLSKTSPSGLLTTTTYDFLGNPVAVTAPDGVVGQNTYDAYGQRTASYANYLDGSPGTGSGIDDVKTAYAYDAFGRQLTSVADTGYSGSPDATMTQTYDQVGNVVTSAESGTGVSARTTTNYFVVYTPPGGSTYSRSVPTGVRMPITPPSSAPDCPGPVAADCTSVTLLDLNGRAIKVTDMYNSSTVTDYDLAGHAVRTIANYIDGVYSGSNPDTDVVSSATYDLAGRLVSTTTCGVSCSGGDLRIIQTTYDNVDRPTVQTAQMPAGTDYSFTKTVYLPSGRVDRTSAPAAAGTAESALSWTRTEYDPAGRAVRTLAHYDSAGNAHYRLDAFEDGNTTGWSSAASGYFTTAAAGSMGLDDDFHAIPGNSGAGRLRVTTHPTSGFSGIWWDLSGQTFQAGRAYHLHADLLGTSGNTLQAFFGVDASGASFGSSGSIATTGAWQTIDIDWTPTSSVSSNVHFALRKDAAGAIDGYLDNVQVWDTTQPDWNIPSETGYDPDGQPITSILPPGHPGEAPMVTATAYDPAGRATIVSVNARTLYSHQISGEGLTNGLVGYWPLDERAGSTVADKKGTNPGSYVGSVSKGVGGAIDEARAALHVSGTSSYVNVPDAASLDLTTAITLEYWANSDVLLDAFKPAGTSFGGVTKASSYGLGWTTKITNGGWRFNLHSASVQYNADSAAMVVEPHRWYHLMGTYDGNVMKLYVDGVLAGSNTIGAKTIDNTANAFRPGEWDSSYWTGALDEVSLYSAALASPTHYAVGRELSTEGRLTTRTEFDALGRPTFETNPRGIRTASSYDRLGRTTATTANYRDGAALGAATDDDLTATFAYDALGELLGSCSPQQVYLSGCAPGTPSNGQAWHYSYDAMGHQATQTPPVNQSLTALSSRAWTYDAGGRLTAICDFAAGGSCATATRHTDSIYDGLGRELTRTVYSGSGTGTPKLAWTTIWNPDGSRASLAFDGTASSEGTDTLTFTYDGLGRPDQVLRSGTVWTDNFWNANGTLASRVDGTLGISTFGYDWAARLTSTSSPVGAGTLTFGWRLDGLMDARQWPAGAGGAATFGYDLAKRPVTFAKAGSAASSFAQTYDRGGNVLSEGRSLTGVSGDAGANTQSFTYDGLSRVTAASGLASAALYAYDRDTNRTSATLAGSTTSYSYDRSAELISRTDSGTTTYLAYDAYGNQTSSAPAVNLNTASTYDLADRLTSITPPSQTATTFTFDALGRYMDRVTPTGTDTYRYVGTSEHVWRISTGGVATSSALDPSGARLATKLNGTVGYLLPDLHANLAAVVNSTETAILNATRYDAFGQTAAAYDSGGAFPNPWRFQSRLDVSPDLHPLYDAGARYYDPGIGAFTQLDSYAGELGDALSLNRYAYAEANPWTLIDPDGHMPLPCGSERGCGWSPPQPVPAHQAPPESPSTETSSSSTATQRRIASPSRSPVYSPTTRRGTPPAGSPSATTPPPGHVAGFCLAISGAAGGYGTFAVCPVWNGFEDISIALTIGGGEGTPGGAIMVEGLTATATNTTQLEGAFGMGGASGSFEVAPISFGGSYFRSVPGANPVIEGQTVGFGLGAPVPEVHSALTYTLVITPGDAMDWLRRVAPQQGGGGAW